MIINTTGVLIDAFVLQLEERYHRTFGGMRNDCNEIIAWAGRMASEIIANGDALYHNVEHTILVTTVGQEILAGKQMQEGGVSCDDWMHVTIALLCHDIGYVRGLLAEDEPDEHRYGDGFGEMLQLPPGSSGAALAPYHVGRGQKFVMDRFGSNNMLKADLISSYVSSTQFPMPDHKIKCGANVYADIVRAADLIGQLGDPRYLHKLQALYYEFDEIGTNDAMGFKNSDDLRVNYPGFFWEQVFPFIKDQMEYLEVTQDGKLILAHLHSNVFRQEHASFHHAYQADKISG